MNTARATAASRSTTRLRNLEEIAAGVPGARRTGFAVPRLPPLPQLVPLIAAGEAARDAREGEAFEELSLRFAGAVIALLAGTQQTDARPSPRDEKRISDALRRIAAQSHERLALADLAGEAAMSRYHFLRTFRHVVGMTPHQFILRTRLHRAAVRLRRSDEAISEIALESGFDDLSTFNRRFRRLMGTTPGAYRARRDGAPDRERGAKCRDFRCRQYPPRHSAPSGKRLRGFALAHIWLKYVINERWKTLEAETRPPVGETRGFPI